MELYHLLLNVASMIINISLVYFSVKLLWVFKGGRLAKPWPYISIGVLSLAIGSSIFTTFYFIGETNAFLHSVGGSLMLLGGSMALIGLYSECKFWSEKE